MAAPLHQSSTYENSDQYPQDRVVAEQLGLIFEDVLPADLPLGGTYTYVVLDDGTMVFGIPNTPLEFGTKHLHLANGRPVKAAGELHINPNGEYFYNIESGTFSKKLIREYGVDPEEMRSSAEQVFKQAFQKEGTFYPVTDDQFLIRPQPNKDDIIELCKHKQFLNYNEHICALI